MEIDVYRLISSNSHWLGSLNSKNKSRLSTEESSGTNVKNKLWYNSRGVLLEVLQYELNVEAYVVPWKDVVNLRITE